MSESPKSKHTSVLMWPNNNLCSCFFFAFQFFKLVTKNFHNNRMTDF